MRALEWILVAFVLAATLPPVAGVYQFMLAGMHRFGKNAGHGDAAGRRASRS